MKELIVISENGGPVKTNLTVAFGLQVKNRF